MSSRTLNVADALRDEGVEVAPDTRIPVALPRDAEALVRAVRRAAAEGWRVVPAGLASKLAWCRPEAHEGDVDLILSTRRLERILAYVPGDGTLTAEAGCRMGDLARHVATQGHRITPDVPHPARATLGGTLSAGVSGPDRLRYGPARHHVLGMRVVLSDGTLAQSGGRLVKNVTGFDLHRLFCGSRGTLCILLEASLRLFPQPQAEEAWSLECASAREGFDAVADLDRLPLQPRSVTLCADPGGGDWRLEIHLAGHPRQLAAEREQLRAAFGAARLSEFAGASAREQAERVRDASSPAGQLPVLRVTSLPSGIERALQHLERDLGVPFRWIAQPLVAVLDVFVEPELAASLTAPGLKRLSAALRETGAELEPRGLPRALHAELAPRASEQPELEWMFRLREAFDPAGIFASPFYPGERGSRGQTDTP